MTHNNNDIVEARRQLKLRLHHYIGWERDTVWRQMIMHARRREEGGLMNLVLKPEKGILGSGR